MSSDASFDTIAYVSACSVLTRKIKTQSKKQIQDLLAVDGIARLPVPCNLPVTRKLEIHHSLQR